MKDLKNKTDTVYMWEDKGSSFTKMRKDQYISTGMKELDKDRFYEEIDDDRSKDIKKECDILVEDMMKKDEIPEKVAEYLVSGEYKLSKYYHSLKTHKIPTEETDVSSWLEAYP